MNDGLELKAMFMEIIWVSVYSLAHASDQIKIK